MFDRFLSRKAGLMLLRNTIVSCGVFAISIGTLFVLVEFMNADEVLAAAIGFLLANSIHYALGRAWIFCGTERHIATGYVYFLASGGLGFAITVGLYAALLEFTPINYLVARVLVSVIAGPAMFTFNATINFRRL